MTLTRASAHLLPVRAGFRYGVNLAPHAPTTHDADAR